MSCMGVKLSPKLAKMFRSRKKTEKRKEEKKRLGEGDFYLHVESQGAGGQLAWLDRSQGSSYSQVYSWLYSQEGEQEEEQYTPSSSSMSSSSLESRMDSVHQTRAGRITGRTGNIHISGELHFMAREELHYKDMEEMSYRMREELHHKAGEELHYSAREELHQKAGEELHYACTDLLTSNIARQYSNSSLTEGENIYSEPIMENSFYQAQSRLANSVSSLDYLESSPAHSEASPGPSLGPSEPSPGPSVSEPLQQYIYLDFSQLEEEQGWLVTRRQNNWIRSAFV